MALDQKTTCIASIMVALMLLVMWLPISSEASSLSSSDAEYNEGDYIPLFVNKLIPQNSTCEAHPYFELPFCPPGGRIPLREKTLDEILAGDCFTNSQYELRFKVEVTEKVLCRKHLNKTEVSKFKSAVCRGFKYDMYYNNIALVGAVGKVELKPGSAPRYYLLRHVDFYPQYMRNQVTGIYLSSNFESAVDITKIVDMEVDFTYSVIWKRMSDSQEDSSRLTMGSWDRDLKNTAEDQSKDNLLQLAYIIALWLQPLLIITVLYLKDYFERYPRGTNRSNALHGDGCECPPYTSLLGAILGTGAQMFFILFGLSIAVYYEYLFGCWSKGLLSIAFGTYCLGSYFSGFTAISIHTRFTRIGLKECLIQTGLLYPFPAFEAYFLVDIASQHYKFLVLPHFDVTAMTAIIWICSTIACLILGGRVACQLPAPEECFTRIPRNETARQKRQRLRRENSRSRMESSQLSFLTRIKYDLLAGVLPFLSVLKHMDGLYASLWRYKICGIIQHSVFVCIMVIIMTIIVGFLATVYQIMRVDNCWWWSSILRGGSTAIYMYAYGVYFFSRTKIASYVKLAYFLTYNFCIFYAVFLALGALGFCIGDIVHCHLVKVSEHDEQD